MRLTLSQRSVTTLAYLSYGDGDGDGDRGREELCRLPVEENVPDLRYFYISVHSDPSQSLKFSGSPT